MSDWTDLLDTSLDGEFMCPEFFMLRGDQPALGNVLSHLMNYHSVLGLINKGDEVLDIGCGCGLATRFYYLKCRSRMVAIDRAKALAVKGALYPCPDIEFIEWDLAKPFDFGKFDKIVMVEVYEHIDDETATTVRQSIAKSLRNEDSRLILTVPILDDLGWESDSTVFHLRSWRTLDEVANELLQDIPAGRLILKSNLPSKDWRYF